MKTLHASPKSRIPILLFILSFTTFPDALYHSAQNTGIFTLNNYARRTVNSTWKTRLFYPTMNVSSGQNYCTLSVWNDEVA